MGVEKPTDIEGCMRELQELLPQLDAINATVIESEKEVAEKRALYDHYRQEYEVCALKHNSGLQPLTEIRSAIQDNQMRAINALLEAMVEGPEYTIENVN